MLLWLVIIIGMLSAFLGIRKGLYRMWILLFNILISIYLAINFTPKIIELVQDTNMHRYNNALCLIIITIAVFIILHLVTGFYLLRIFALSLPKGFSKIGGGILGFLTGYLSICFLLIVLLAMPFSKKQPAKKFLESHGSKPVALKSVEKACNFIDVISLQDRRDLNERILKWLITPGYDMKFNPKK